MTHIAAPSFRVLGTTDEVTECQHCGRTELKGTVRLGILDADGNVEDVTYFGATCGARAAGWTVKDLRKAASAADRAAVEAAQIERDRQHDVERTRVHLTYGTVECMSGPTMCRRERAYCVAHSA